MYELKLQTKTPALIGGQSSSLTINKITARRNGKPFLPGSALKGALRLEFEKLMLTIDEPICRWQEPENEAFKETNAELEQERRRGWNYRRTDGGDCRKERCIVCRLFGGPGGQQGNAPGKLRFSDGVLTSDFSPDAYVQRMGVSLSRKLRRAEKGRLYSQEAAPETLNFLCCLRLLSPLDDTEKQLFEAALEWWKLEGFQIGGGRTRGFGFLALTDFTPPAASPPRPSFPVRSEAATETLRLYRLRFLPLHQERPEEWEPLRISAAKRPGSYLLDSLRYIPGSTLRGAVGWGLHAAQVEKDAISELLLHRTLRFSHLYPMMSASSGRGGFLQTELATTVQCKADSNHGTYDTLLMQYALKRALPDREPPRLPAENMKTLFERLFQCPQCGTGLRPVERFGDIGRQLYIKLALDRRLGRAQEGQFYIYEALAEGMAFDGRLLASPESVEQLQALPEGLLLGGARSKGFGLGTLEITEADDSLGNRRALRTRFEGLNGFLDSLLREVTLITGEPPQFPDRDFYTVTLLTDFVPLPGCSLEQLITENPEWRVETAVVEWTRLGGFHEKRGQSKPLLSALQQGGSLLFSAPYTQRHETLARLLSWETEGIGLLREEGFGWISACHEAHWERVMPNKKGTLNA